MTDTKDHLVKPTSPGWKHIAVDSYAANHTALLRRLDRGLCSTHPAIAMQLLVLWPRRAVNRLVLLAVTEAPFAIK
jgi:hypothetical protein